MEHTGLIMTPPQDFVVTHELAHEWWYALISNDQAEAPWLDEAFASYAEEAAGAQGHPWCRRSGRGTPPRHARHRVLPRAAGFRGYGVVYSEGACLLDLLRERMGAARFDAALRGYALAHRYGWSTAAAFRAAMDAASPVPLDDLWRRYRRSVGGRPRAVARVRLVARRRAAVPERAVDRRRRRGAVRGDEQLDGVHRAGADLHLLGASCASSSPRSMRATSAGSNASTPSMRSTWGTRLSANSVSAARSSAGAMPCRCRSAAAICARLKNGTGAPS